MSILLLGSDIIVTIMKSGNVTTAKRLARTCKGMLEIYWKYLTQSPYLKKVCQYFIKHGYQSSFIVLFNKSGRNFKEKYEYNMTKLSIKHGQKKIFNSLVTKEIVYIDNIDHLLEQAIICNRIWAIESMFNIFKCQPNMTKLLISTIKCKNIRLLNYLFDKSTDLDTNKIFIAAMQEYRGLDIISLIKKLNITRDMFFNLPKNIYIPGENYRQVEIYFANLEYD